MVWLRPVGSRHVPYIQVVGVATILFDETRSGPHAMNPVSLGEADRTPTVIMVMQALTSLQLPLRQVLRILIVAPFAHQNMSSSVQMALAGNQCIHCVELQRCRLPCAIG